MTTEIPVPSGLPSALTANLSDTVVCGQAGITRQMTLQLITSLALQNVIFSGNGDPNGNVAGNVNNLYWDKITNNLWICSVSGSIVTAVWVKSDPGLITPAEGGTGVSNPLAHTIPVAEGTSNFNFVALNDGQILIGTTGSDPVAANITAGSNISITNGPGTVTIAINGVIPSSNGGTGVAAPTIHSLPIAQGASAFNFTTLNNGQILIGATGVDPVPGNILPGAHITITNGPGTISIDFTGILTTANGGTGVGAWGNNLVVSTNTVGSNPMVGISPTVNLDDFLGSNGLAVTASFKNPPFRLINIQVFKASGTYTPISSRVNHVRVRAWGAGASGSGTTGANTAACGGGGAYAEGFFANTVPQTITIGTGGVSVIANVNNVGNPGTDTSFGTLVIAKGGQGGGAGTPATGGVGGLASSSTGNVLTLDGGSGRDASNLAIGIGGAAPMIGVQPKANAGSAGPANSGSGGCGGSSAVASGAGANGLIIVEEYS